MNDFSKIREWIHKRLENRSRTDFFIMILVGILLMVIVIPTDDGEKEKEERLDKEGEPAQEQAVYKEYTDIIEEQLEALLEKMDGVGQCEVMITWEDEGETYLDKNVTNGEKQYTEETVVYDGDSGEEPYVVRKTMPKAAGVVVVTPGGENPKVVTEISSAVMSLLQVEVHKITVVKMSVQEESF